MFNLPQQTAIRKTLPKKAIYAKLGLSTAQCESFDADFSRIDIVAEISPRTIPGISEGENIKTFYVLLAKMKQQNYNKTHLQELSKLIPQNMVFALLYEEKIQFAVYYSRLIISEWEAESAAQLPLVGLNLDAVWENLIQQIGQIRVEEGNTLTTQIEQDEQRAKTQAKITALEKQMVREKQPRKKRLLFEEITKLKKTLE